MNDFESRLAAVTELASQTAEAMDSIRPPNALTPIEQLQGKEREAVEGWLNDAQLLLRHADFIGHASNAELPTEQRERYLAHAEGGLMVLHALVMEFKRTGKTLLERMPPQA